jgi:transposase
LTLAAIYDGVTRTEAALGGVTLQIIRDWVMRFNAGGAAGLLDGKSPGQPSRLNDVQRQAIVRMIESGPIPAIHGVVRWRLIDLSQWIYEEFRITVAKQTLSRELRAMATASSQPDPAIMRKPREQSRILKKVPSAPGGSRAQKNDRHRQDRNWVPGRGSYRPEEQDHPQVGEARQSPERSAGSANRLYLHLRCHLPETG